MFVNSLLKKTGFSNEAKRFADEFCNLKQPCVERMKKCESLERIIKTEASNTVT